MRSPDQPSATGPHVAITVFGMGLGAGQPPAPAALAVAWGGAQGFPSQFAGRWLRGEEAQRFHSLRHEGVRGDFLLGRMAAKSALSACAPSAAASDWEIRRGVWHQPAARGPVPGLGVTLAHDRGIAVALAFDDRAMCGIDVEPLARDVRSAAATQVCGTEASWARQAETAATRPPSWHLLWTAREALGKCLRFGLLRPGMLAPTEHWVACMAGWSAGFADGDLLAARSVVSAGYVVTFVFPRSAVGAPALDRAALWLSATLGQAGAAAGGA